MNQQIQNLKDKIWTEEYWTNPNTDKLLPAQLNRFAELIVRECVQTLIDNTPERYTNEAAEEDWDKGYDQAMRDCVHHIQEHFGVE